MTDDSSRLLRFLPVGLSVAGKACLVVGGGNVGTRKVRNLLRAGAVVTVVSPLVTDELAEVTDRGDVRWVRDVFCDDLVGDPILVVAATDDGGVNESIIRLCRRRGVLVCDASAAERSDVIFGALHQQDDAIVAVFTDGHDPKGSRKTRDRIARLLAQDGGPD